MSKIQYKQGNLLSVTEGMIAHGCNARGVMGSGVALAIREKYPQTYVEYKSAVGSGSSGIYKVGVTLMSYPTDSLVIANCITQDNYGKTGERYVNYWAISKCFERVITYCNTTNIKSVNFPKIGAGLGGGDWGIISQIIEDIHCGDLELICWELS